VDHIITDEAPWVPVFNEALTFFVSARLGNFQASAEYGPLVNVGVTSAEGTWAASAMPALSAWEVYGAARLPPADSVTCRDLVGLSASDPWLPASGHPVGHAAGTDRHRSAVMGESSRPVPE
jgi:hypothetical protein